MCASAQSWVSALDCYWVSSVSAARPLASPHKGKSGLVAVLAVQARKGWHAEPRHDAGGIIGPALIGALSDKYSYGAAIITLGAFNLLAALLFITFPGRGLLSAQIVPGSHDAALVLELNLSCREASDL